MVGLLNVVEDQHGGSEAGQCSEDLKESLLHSVPLLLRLEGNLLRQGGHPIGQTGDERCQRPEPHAIDPFGQLLNSQWG